MQFDDWKTAEVYGHRGLVHWPTGLVFSRPIKRKIAKFWSSNASYVDLFSVHFHRRTPQLKRICN